MDRRISPPVLGGKPGSGSAGSSGGSTHSPLLASVRASSPPAALSIPAGMTQQPSSSSRVGLLTKGQSHHNDNNAAQSLSSPTANGGSGTGSATFGDHKTSASSSSAAASINVASLSQRSPFSCPRHSFGDDPVDLVVTIDKSEIRNDPLTNSQFSVFLITVRTCCVTWTIYRRYSEFEQLHKDLVRDHAGVKVPSLPPKKFLGSSLDAEFVNSRRQQLELYVRTLLHEPTLFQSKILAVFIQGRKNDALGVLCDQYAEMKNRFIAMCAKVSRLEQQLREVDAIVKQADNAQIEMEQQKKDIRTLKRRVYELELERDARLLGGRDGDSGRSGNNSVMAMDGTDRWLGLPGLPSSSTFPLPNARGRRSASWYDYYLPFKPGEDTSPPYDSAATAANNNNNAYENERWPSFSANGSGLAATGGGYHPHTRGVAVHAGGGGLGDFRSLSDMSDQLGSGSAAAAAAAGEYRKRAMSDRSYLAASIPSKSLHTDQLAARHFPYRTTTEPRTSPFDSHLNDLIEKRRGEKEAKADKKREKVSRLLSSASSPGLLSSAQRDTAAVGSSRSSGRDSSRDSSREGRSSANGNKDENGDGSDAITIDGKTGMVYDGSDSKDRRTSATAGSSSSSGLTRPGTSPVSGAGGLSRLMELQRRKQFLKLRDEKMNNIRKEKASSSGTAPSTSSSTGASMLMMSKKATSSGTAATSTSSSSSSSTTADSSKDDDKDKGAEAVSGRTLSDTAPVPVPTSSSRGQASTGSTVAGSMDTLDASSLSSTDASPNTHSLPADLTGTPSSPPIIATVSTSAPSKVPTRAIPSSSSASSSTSSSIAVTMTPIPASVSSLVSEAVGSLPSGGIAAGSPPSSDDTASPTTSTAVVASAAAADKQPVYEIDPRELQAMLESRLLDEELNDRVEDLIKFVKPTSASEARYTETLGFVETLIKKTLGAEVYPHGSFALKTYLPDADLDVSAFFSKGIASSWVQRLVTALCQEANSTSADPKFAVRSVTFVNADVRVVKCQIGRISVDISGNQMNALATLAFFEEIDKLVGKDHLFKRSILLSKTFFENESRIVGAHHGYLSSYCLRTLVLYIFNAYHLQIHTPLQALYMLLSYLEKFNWDEHALGLFGPIKLSALPKFEVVSRAPCSWPNGATPLITQQLFQAYSTVVPHPKRIQTDSNGNQRVLEPKYLNVIDPANPFNNLGRSVSFQNSTRIRQAFAIGAAKFRVKLLKFVPAIYRPTDEPTPAAPAAATSTSVPDVKKSTLVPTSAVFVPASESSLSSSVAASSSSSTTATSSPVKATARAPMSSGMAAALERERERERKSLREKERERERERERNGEDADPLDATTDDNGKDGKDGEESEAHRIVTDLFQRTLFKYGGRMRYAFSPKPRPKPTPAVEPASLPPAAAAAAPSTALPVAAIESKAPQATTGAPSSNAAIAMDGGMTSFPSPIPSMGNGGDILNADLDHILHNLQHARQFEVPDISELDLVGLIEKVLAEHGSIPVGKMGSLLHTVINNHSLPAMLKERYGGLKKFLERHTEVFSIGDDHPFNPHVHLISSSGAIPNIPPSLYGLGMSLPTSGTVSPADSAPSSPHGSGSSSGNNNMMATPTSGGNRFAARGTVVTGSGPGPSPSSSLSPSASIGSSNGAVSPPPQSNPNNNNMNNGNNGRGGMMDGRQTPPHWTQQPSSNPNNGMGGGNVGNMYVQPSVEPRRGPGPIGSAPGGSRGGGGGGVNVSGPPGFGNSNGAIAPPNAYNTHSYSASSGSGARLPSSSGGSMMGDGYGTRGGVGGSMNNGGMDAYTRAEYEASMAAQMVANGRANNPNNGVIAPPGSNQGGGRDRRRQQRPPSNGGAPGSGRDNGVGSGNIANAAASVGSVPNGPPAYYGPGVIDPHSKSGYNAAALPFTPAGHVTHGQPSHQHTANAGSGYGHGMMSHLASHPRS